MGSSRSTLPLRSESSCDHPQPPPLWPVIPLYSGLACRAYSRSVCSMPPPPFSSYARGFPAVASFLALPVDRHYFYQGFSNLPVSLASWWLMGSSIDLMAP